MKRRMLILTCLLAGLVSCAETRGQGVRIKDITDIEGARGNQLYGVGLVVGLSGTGSRSSFTQQMAVDMLQKLSIGTKIAQEAQTDNVFKSNNISAVMVTAEIGAFSRCGSRLDVLVSILDDATSLQGGTLLLTPLRGADSEVYVVAQGSISVGGFSVSGQAATAQKNHPAVGRIPGGAIVEHEVPGEILCHGQVHLLLRDPDYLTARGIGDAICARFPYSAIAVNAGAVHVFVPPERRGDLVAFVSELGVIEVNPDAPARVIINERTGTIVAGEQVKVSTMAVANGNLAIVTSEEAEASQPAPFSKGKTVVVPRTRIGVSEQGGAVNIVSSTVTVADLARALNALGVSPRDLIAIFQAIKLAGGLHAELILM